VCAATPDARGLKRVCSSCGIRFYDLNKRPIACPNCATEFTGEIKVKSRRSRIIADDPIMEAKGKKAPANDLDDDLDDLAEEAEVVSLEELEEGDDDDAEIVPDSDLDLDEDLEVLEDDDLDDLEDAAADLDDEDGDKG